MELAGGSWIWSASLRYFFMIPFLFIIVAARKNITPLVEMIKQHPVAWLLWSFVGFGLFYAPLSFAAAYGAGWLIAGTWQVTIISGSLLAPLFYETVQTKNGFHKIRGKIPLRGLLFSMLILFGVLLLQLEQAKHLSIKHVLLSVFPVLLASFAYPLGNRKMMQLCKGKLDVYQRVLGMTLASVPFWLLLSFYGVVTVGLPSANQIFQSLLVAITSGVIATVLFFQATELVKDNMQQLAAVEATQSVEILFALAGEMLVLNTPFPTPFSWAGIIFVVIGMMLHSYLSRMKRITFRRHLDM